MNPASWRADGTAATTTPRRLHRTRGASASRKHNAVPRSSVAIDGALRPGHSPGSAAGNVGIGQPLAHAGGRDHQRLPLTAVVKVDLLDHRSPQPEQRVPYPDWAHVATAPFPSVPAVKSERRSPAACAPVTRRSGAPSAPTSLPQSADGGGCQAAPTPPRAAKTSRGPHPRPRRCLIRRRQPRYPATAVTSPTERAGQPQKVRDTWAQSGSLPVRPLGGMASESSCSTCSLKTSVGSYSLDVVSGRRQVLHQPEPVGEWD